QTDGRIDGWMDRCVPRQETGGCLHCRSSSGHQPSSQARQVNSSCTISLSLQVVQIQQQLTSPLRITSPSSEITVGLGQKSAFVFTHTHTHRDTHTRTHKDTHTENFLEVFFGISFVHTI